MRTNPPPLDLTPYYGTFRLQISTWRLTAPALEQEAWLVGHGVGSGAARDMAGTRTRHCGA